jgi:hypothetical protein
MAETQHARVKSFVLDELDAGNIPISLEDVCLIGARSAEVAGLPPPIRDVGFANAARGMAEGLFGPAYANAGADKRALWVNACEAALRKVFSKPN